MEQDTLKLYAIGYSDGRADKVWATDAADAIEQMTSLLRKVSICIDTGIREYKEEQ